MNGKRLREVLEDTDPGGLCLADPVCQEPVGRAPVGLFPELPQILFEVVGFCERLVKLQGLFQTPAFSARVIEVLGSSAAASAFLSELAFPVDPSLRGA